MLMTTTARPSTRRSTRLRKGTLALLAYNVREQAAQAQAETIAAQATKKRLAQDDGETKAPPSKHSAVPKPLPRLSTKSTIESPEKTGQKVRQRFMETIQEQKESTESTEPSDSEESSREELDLEDSNLPEHVELSGHRGANQDKATLPRKVKEAQSTPLAKIPGAVNPYPAARVTKRTEKKVTFVPTPFKKPSRLPRSPTMVRQAGFLNLDDTKFQNLLSQNQLQAELDHATPPLDAMFTRPGSEAVYNASEAINKTYH